MLRLLVICALFGLVCRAEDDNGPVFGSPERRAETALMETLLERLLENKKTAGDKVCPTAKPSCGRDVCSFTINDLGKLMFANVIYFPTEDELVIQLEVFGKPHWKALIDETKENFKLSMPPYITAKTFGFGHKTYKVHVGSIDTSGHDLVVKDFCFVEV